MLVMVMKIGYNLYGGRGLWLGVWRTRVKVRVWRTRVMVRSMEDAGYGYGYDGSFGYENWL